MSQIGYFNYCLNIFWSLSVEEVFYLVFPILCVLRKKGRFILLFWIGLIIAAPIYRSHYTQDEIVALYGYFSCFDAIAMGCLSAIIVRKIQWNARWFTISQYAAVLVLIAVYFYSAIMQNVVMGVSLVALSTSILLIGTHHIVLAHIPQ